MENAIMVLAFVTMVIQVKSAKKDSALTIVLEMEYVWKESVIVVFLTLENYVAIEFAD